MPKSSTILFRIKQKNILGIIRTQNRTQQILAGRFRIKNYSFTCNHNRSYSIGSVSTALPSLADILLQEDPRRGVWALFVNSSW